MYRKKDQGLFPIWVILQIENIDSMAEAMNLRTSAGNIKQHLPYFFFTLSPFLN
jgi:hypothetical protein